MSSPRDTVLQALRDVTLIDPHTHINPYNPASQTLADLLGYHYYTELAHSAGMPKEQIESAGIGPRELVRRLVGGLGHLSNTVQSSWLVDLCQRFYGFEDDAITLDNWETLYDQAEATMASADWPSTVLQKSNVSAVFLTNDFDDTLEGFDTSTYIPCLRTDDLVFHLAKPEVRQRLSAASGSELSGSLDSLRRALEQRFEHFIAHGARACAISLPPDFCPTPVSDGRALTALDAVLHRGLDADASHRAALSRRVFWTLAELCDQYRLPFDLMIGVNREVYRGGVHQGRDLYDSRVSLIQYRELFNTFANVKFPVSVLASVTNQELVSYAWIFPNVIPNGHWWYSNTPTYIRHDAAARLEAVPRNKQIGYYSDAYKLEFIAPKFEMYRRILADILAENFIGLRGWSETQAIELGTQVLRGNVETIFPDLSDAPPTAAPLPSPATAGERAAAAAGFSTAAAAAGNASATEDATGLVSDPVTGELTWPVGEQQEFEADYQLDQESELPEPYHASPVPDDLLEVIEQDDEELGGEPPAERREEPL